MTWSNRNEGWKIAKSLFQRRFLCRRRRRILRSLLYDGDNYENGAKKVNWRLLQTLSRLLYLVQFIKCWLIFLELNSEGLYQRSGKKKESRCLVFSSSTKRGIRHFHFVDVQRRQRNVQKRVMHVQSCCFGDKTLLLFCRSRCRRRLRCLSSPLGWQTMHKSLRPGARFSKVPIINGPGKLLPFTLKVEV